MGNRLGPLRADNFMLYGSGVQFSFDPGFYYLEGENRDDPYSASNGAGKSVLPEALYWVLYGKTIRSMAVERVVNEVAGRGCLVEVDLETPEGSYLIRRYRKHSEYGARGVQLLKRTGKGLTAHRTADTDEQIEALLGMNADRFLQTVILEGSMQWSFANMRDSERKEFLEEVTDQAIWEAFGAQARSELRAAQSDVERVRLQLQDLKSQMQTLFQRRGEREQETGAVEDLQRQLRQAKQQARALSQPSPEIAQLSEEQVSMQGVLTAAEEQLHEAETALEERQQRTLELVKEENRLRGRLEDLASIEALGVCPTCEQEADAAQLQKKQRSYSKTLKTLVDRQVGPHRLEVERIASQRQELREGASALRQQLKGLQQRLQSLSKDRERERREAERALAGLQERVEGASRMDRDAQEQVEQLQARVAEVAEELADAQRRSSGLEFWVKHAPQLRARAMEAVFGFLNTRLSAYAEVLFEGEERVWTEQDPKGRISVLTERKGYVRTHEERSSGERRRNDLALRYSLNDLSTTLATGSVPPVLIQDEVLDTLDPVSIERVLRLLSDRVEQEHLCIYVTSHNPTVLSALPEGTQRLRSVREGDQARIELLD